MSRLHAPAAIRTRLFAAVLIASAVVVAVLVTGFNVALQRTLDSNATSLAEARAAAVLSTLTVAPGAITVHEAPDDAAIDTQIWVFAGRSLVEAPEASTAARTRAAARTAAAAPAVADAPGRIRIASIVVNDHGAPVGAVVAGVPLAPNDATARTALVASIVLGLGLLGAVAALTFWTLRRALQPVYEMTRLAETGARGRRSSGLRRGRRTTS